MVGFIYSRLRLAAAAIIPNNLAVAFPILSFPPENIVPAAPPTRAAKNVMMAPIAKPGSNSPAAAPTAAHCGPVVKNDLSFLNIPTKPPINPPSKPAPMLLPKLQA